MTEQEVWKDVPSAPGLMASSFGRIRVKGYSCKMPNHGMRTYPDGKPTTGVWDGTRFLFRHNRSRKNHKVARLVCEAFNGPAPEGKPVCMHLDEDARNNRPENLAWGSQKENLNAPGFLKYCKSRVGDLNPLVKGKKF